MNRKTTFILLLTTLLPPSLKAKAAPTQPSLREQARQVMRTHCGTCHIPYTETSNPKALNIFDLANEDWSTQLSKAQLQSVLRRFESRESMSKAELSELVPKGVKPPPQPTTKEIETIRKFILEEQLRY